MYIILNGNSVIVVQVFRIVFIRYTKGQFSRLLRAQVQYFFFLLRDEILIQRDRLSSLIVAILPGGETRDRV